MSKEYKYKLENMTKQDYEFVDHEFYTCDETRLAFDDNKAILELWKEHPHNGDPYDEIAVEIELPSWLVGCFNENGAHVLRASIKSINGNMQNLFDAMILLNQQAEKYK